MLERKCIMNDKLKLLLNSDYINKLMPKDKDGYNLSTFVYYFSFFLS